MSFPFHLHSSLFYASRLCLCKVTCNALQKVAVKIMVHVMSSQLLWPTTAKKRKSEKSTNPCPWGYFFFNDVTTLWVASSNNEPWAIWEISNGDSLLIDLKLSSHICWTYGTGLCMDPTPFFGVVTVVFGQLDLTGHPCTSEKIVNVSSTPWEACVVQLYTVNHAVMSRSLKGLHVSHNNWFSKLKLVVLLIV